MSKWKYIIFEFSNKGYTIEKPRIPRVQLYWYIGEWLRLRGGGRRVRPAAATGAVVNKRMPTGSQIAINRALIGLLHLYFQRLRDAFFSDPGVD